MLPPAGSPTQIPSACGPGHEPSNALGCTATASMSRRYAESRDVALSSPVVIEGRSMIDVAVDDACTDVRFGRRGDATVINARTRPCPERPKFPAPLADVVFA